MFVVCMYMCMRVFLLVLYNLCISDLMTIAKKFSPHLLPFPDSDAGERVVARHFTNAEKDIWCVRDFLHCLNEDSNRDKYMCDNIYTRNSGIGFRSRT